MELTVDIRDIIIEYALKKLIKYLSDSDIEIIKEIILFEDLNGEEIKELIEMTLQVSQEEL